MKGEHWQLLMALVGGDADESEAMVAICVQSYILERTLARAASKYTCNRDKILPFKTEFDGRVEEHCRAWSSSCIRFADAFAVCSYA